MTSTLSSVQSDTILVIGSGLMGSSAAWGLAKQGAKVLVIEQQDSIYTFGSSLGEARISRNLGPKNDIFSFLQKISVAETAQLIDFLNEGNEGTPHSMDEIYSTSPVTYIYYEDQQDEVIALLEEGGENIELAANPQSARKLFDMKIPEKAMIIREFKQYSGTLNPRVLISKLHQAIQKAGGNVLFNEKVCRLEKADGLFKVELRNTKTGKIQQLESKRLLIAAGAFNGSLMKTIAPRVDQLIHPQRTCLTFIKINDETYTRLSAKQKQRFRDFYPVAEMSGDVFYSMIEHVEDDGSPLLKVGGHFLRTTVDNLDSVWQQELSPQEIEWSVNYTLTYLAMLNLPVQASDLVFVRGYSCVYALTESEIPLVCHVSDDAHEIDPNCVLIGGMSGVGAKGSLAYGLIAANLLLDKDDSSEMYQKTKLALGAHTTLK